MNRQDAIILLQKHLKDPTNLNHSRESEAIMRALAKKLNQDQDYWGNLGLLHDIDWEYGEKTHCRRCVEILSQAGFDQDFINTIVSHAYGFAVLGQDFLDKKRETNTEHLLAAAETITGLIYATALVRPEKKLENVEISSIKKKMKDKSFAASVNRGIIKECELAGISLDEFIEISLGAMKEIASEISL
ncbi:MAG: HDIG domain-containing metalloprotein [Candidatus Buchananbacteria bacterium]